MQINVDLEGKYSIPYRFQVSRSQRQSEPSEKLPIIRNILAHLDLRASPWARLWSISRTQNLLLFSVFLSSTFPFYLIFLRFILPFCFFSAWQWLFFFFLRYMYPRTTWRRVACWTWVIFFKKKKWKIRNSTSDRPKPSECEKGMLACGRLPEWNVEVV